MITKGTFFLEENNLHTNASNPCPYLLSTYRKWKHMVICMYKYKYVEYIWSTLFVQAILPNVWIPKQKRGYRQCPPGLTILHAIQWERNICKCRVTDSCSDTHHIYVTHITFFFWIKYNSFSCLHIIFHKIKYVFFILQGIKDIPETYQ